MNPDILDAIRHAHMVYNDSIHGVRGELEYENYVAENQIMTDQCARCGTFYPRDSLHKRICPKCLGDLMKIERYKDIYEV